jgi:hypothetical protein
MLQRRRSLATTANGIPVRWRPRLLSISSLAAQYRVTSGGAPYHITALMRGEYVSQGNAISFTAPYGAWPYFGYFAQGGSGGLVAGGGLRLAGVGGYTCGHTNQANNDGTALMYPMSNGTWP